MAPIASRNLLDALVLDESAQRLLFTEARTANTFTDVPVTDEQLRAIYELAKFPPTAANTNPLRVLYLRKGAGRDRLLPHMAEGNRAKTASAPVVAVLASDYHFHDHLPHLFAFKPEMGDYFAADDAAREGTAQYNGALQAAYFLLAVRAAGLAAGPMVGFDSAGVDAEFFADSQWRSHLVVNIGTPGPHAWFDRLPRMAYEDAVRHA
ncbi:MAG: malonic semialdehyde reductase [Solirubrobacterales bacterium]|nr:malonic semialdehyde reductase [Solirubrobacterales bacterium]